MRNSISYVLSVVALAGSALAIDHDVSRLGKNIKFVIDMSSAGATTP